MRKAKRTIAKAKTYGFNPWADQIDSINVIITKTGAKEATILRKLVDEALTARRLKEAGKELEEFSGSAGLPSAIETIQALLLKLVQQGDTIVRMGDVSLAVLQETLAEARAGRKFAWNRAVPEMKEQGLSASDITKRFDKETVEGKRFAYAVAKEIKDEQD
jgi:MoxR-like ATPase